MSTGRNTGNSQVNKGVYLLLLLGGGALFIINITLGTIQIPLNEIISIVFTGEASRQA